MSDQPCTNRGRLRYAWTYLPPPDYLCVCDACHAISMAQTGFCPGCRCLNCWKGRKTLTRLAEAHDKARVYLCLAFDWPIGDQVEVRNVA